MRSYWVRSGTNPGLRRECEVSRKQNIFWKTECVENAIRDKIGPLNSSDDPENAAAVNQRMHRKMCLQSPTPQRSRYSLQSRKRAGVGWVVVVVVEEGGNLMVV